MGQQDVGKVPEASVAESTNFTLSGSQTGRPDAAKSRLVEVVNRKLSRFGPETAEKSLVLLRYAQTHLRDGLVGVGRQRKKSALPHPVYPAGPFEDRGAVTYVTVDDLAMAPQRWLI